VINDTFVNARIGQGTGPGGPVLPDPPASQPHLPLQLLAMLAFRFLFRRRRNYGRAMATCMAVDDNDTWR